MKINKILAAGVAATLAVTSLSAVASAETKSYTWKMDYTFSKIQWNGLRMQWLDDNDYITRGTGSFVLAAGQLKAGLDAFDAAIGGAVAAKQDANDTAAIVLDGTADHLGTGGAGAAVDATGALTATLTAANTSVKTAIKNADDLITAAIAAGAVAQAPATAALEKTKDLLSATETVKNYYNKAITAIASAIVTVEDEAVTLNLTAAEKAQMVKHLEAVGTKIANALTNLETVINTARQTLNGTPLLADTEVGGIYIDRSAKEITLNNTKYFVKVTGAKLTIKGTKVGSTASESYSSDFKTAYKAYGADLRGTTEDPKYLFLAFAPKYVNREGFANLNVFGTITDASIDVNWTLYERNADGTVGAEVEKFSEEEYDKVKKTTMQTLRALTNIDYIDTTVNTPDDVDTWTPETQFADGTSRLTNTVAELDDHSTALYKLFYGLDKSVVSGDVTENSNSKKTLKPFIKMTTGTEGATIYRDNVLALSYTDAYKSLTINDKRDFNQTYDDAGMGTAPKWFAGLASQCADFFDKQNNGQVIFKFQDPATADKWVSYGVPSTEVGLRTLQGTAMALFFNYTTSTGSIQTIGVVDKDAWTITFDMATVLDDFGTRTKATLEDIFYGLNTGLQYGDPYNGKGYVVEEVKLQYDDAPAAVDASTDDDAAVVVADDDDDDVVADDDDDDIFADDDVVADDDDDDDDAGIIEDDDDDDTDVNNDVDYVDGADDDANPGTGVGLAVIPAIVAAAAAIVSKKRK